MRIKDTFHIFDENGLGLAHCNLLNRDRKKIALIIFTQLLPRNGEGWQGKPPA